MDIGEPESRAEPSQAHLAPLLHHFDTTLTPLLHHFYTPFAPLKCVFFEENAHFKHFDPKIQKIRESGLSQADFKQIGILT